MFEIKFTENELNSLFTVFDIALKSEGLKIFNDISHLNQKLRTVIMNKKKQGSKTTEATEEENQNEEN